MKRHISFILVLLVVLGLVGCVINSPPSIEPTIDPDAEQAAALFDEAQMKYESGNTMGAIEDAIAAREVYPTTEYTDFILEKRDELIEKTKRNLYVDNDEMDETTFVFAREDYIKIKSGNLWCYAYVNDRANTPVFRFKMSFYDDEWVFSKLIKLKGGDATLEIVGDWYTDVWDGGTIFESLDEKLTSGQIDKLREVLKAEIVDVRFYGSKRNVDFVLNEAQIADVLTMLDYYDLKCIE